MRLTEFFESNYRIKRLRGKSQNTVRLYRTSIRNLEKVLKRPANIEDLTDDVVSQVMQDVLDRGGSPFTANKERSQLLALWRYASQTGLTSNWPTVLPENEPERVPQAWMQEDLVKLFDAIAGIKTNVGNVPGPLWWRAIFLVCLDTGERIGAISQAEWSWLERNWLLVPAEARKGRKRDRRYLLASETVAALMQVRKYSCGATNIFVWPYNRTYIWNRLTKILIDAGLPHGRKDKFHRIRKTVGSVVYAAGMDPQDALDHSHRRVTQKYLDPRFTRETQPSQIIADWLRNPPTDLKRKQA